MRSCTLPSPIPFFKKPFPGGADRFNREKFNPSNSNALCKDALPPK